jgi:hypothetical protein
MKNELEKLARELSRYANIVAVFKKESYAHSDKQGSSGLALGSKWRGLPRPAAQQPAHQGI